MHSSLIVRLVSPPNQSCHCLEPTGKLLFLRFGHYILQQLNRHPKRLFTDRDGGPQTVVLEAYDEQEEGDMVVSEIRRLVSQGEAQFGDCAVMYRTNAQSRPIEDAFVRRGVPYKLVGATRFYERKEIKDVLSYLRVLHNPYDGVGLVRIVNVPPRAIGQKTVGSLE